MDIRNQTKNNLVCIAKDAGGFLGRARGLMFTKNLASKEGLVMKFHHRNIVHSMFMRFSIDLIFLDSQRMVVEVFTLMPWKFYKPKKNCRWLIEVNQGIITEKNIEIGDEIEFIS